MGDGECPSKMKIILIIINISMIDGLKPLFTLVLCDAASPCLDHYNALFFFHSNLELTPSENLPLRLCNDN